jgi:hypothetical protein
VVVRGRTVGPGSSAVSWIDQRVPFQRSTSVEMVPVVMLPASEDPTAVHAPGEVHETLSRTLELAPDGFGVD